MPSYNFQDNREVLTSIVLGDLDPEYVKDRGVDLTLDYTYDSFTENAVLAIAVEVPSRKKSFRSKEVVSSRDMREQNVDWEHLLWRALHSLARKMSMTLLEYDPRIGLPLNDEFPNSPLFDPPGVNLPYEKYLNPGRSHNLELLELHKSLTTCPFCELRIAPYGDSTQEGVWGGGNIRFAHKECVPWVEPQR
jgi:hypothetical protein